MDVPPNEDWSERLIAEGKMLPATKDFHEVLATMRKDPMDLETAARFEAAFWELRAEER